VHIRDMTDANIDSALEIERRAFGEEDEADLVHNLLGDPSAQPALSLLAYQDDRAVGHILFTKAHLAQSPVPVSATLLAPLAVVPDAQKQGVGAHLIAHGLKRLTQDGVDLVFVLGHPDYYPRCGFEPAGRLGFEAPYPIPEMHADAWMVQALRPGVIGSAHGRVQIATAIDKAEYWRE